MFRYLLSFLLLMVAYGSAQGKKGHEIDIYISGFDQSEIYLAYYYGDKQYIRDTTARTENGTYVFSGEETLPAGVYLVVLPPDSRYFEILIDDNEQHFSISTSYNDLVGSMRFEGKSADNERFYAYLNFLAERRPIADSLQAVIDGEGSEYSLGKGAARIELRKINNEISKYQQNLITRNPSSLSAALIKSGLPLDVPEFEGNNAETLRWRWFQRHFFDNFELDDPRLLRTPVLLKHVNYYVYDLQVQDPDTISAAIDWVLNKMEPAEETFKYYVIHFVNKAANSKIMGMDAVYVHMVNAYYASGKADWTDGETLEKMLERARALEPLLIGKIAPNATWRKRDESTLQLHDIDSPFTLLFFWKADCGTCTETADELKPVYTGYKDKGLSILAICTKYAEEVQGCWDYVDENGLGDWIHVADPMNEFGGASLYDVKSTPTIYLLDSKKEIISKRVTPEQVAQILDNYLNQ